MKHFIWKSYYRSLPSYQKQKTYVHHLYCNIVCIILDIYICFNGLFYERFCRTFRFKRKYFATIAFPSSLHINAIRKQVIHTKFAQNINMSTSILHNILIFFFFFNWDSLCARLNSHYKELQEKETEKD